eukprot:CAMPEP_0116836456 /NCGR_PEP_ID=MMETSP0418-20121206/8107_1 /TAXON_ID=1158023 /ORGANISM="Astrosyne radiata, Strain 13vi08-1A" /LENGTH=357 /DNA_ID=CAMNT_0004466229 /DNA_START=83 /DNA_END=1156 /DNA_ORIENTATION=-
MMYGDSNVQNSIPGDDEKEVHLSVTRRNILERKLGFSHANVTKGFVRRKRRRTFQQGLVELADFRRVHGHLVVPRTIPFGKWVQHQRERYGPLKKQLTRIMRRHYASSTHQEVVSLEDTPGTANFTEKYSRVMALDDLGFVWNVPEYRWKIQYKRLIVYKSQHGNFDVPSGYGQLGWWVREQRKSFLDLLQGRKSKMTFQRARALKRIGFDFIRKNPPKKRMQAQFEKNIESLKEYLSSQRQTTTATTNNGGMVVVNQMPNSLQSWVELQRLHYRKWLKGIGSPLDIQNRRHRLESTGIVDDLMTNTNIHIVNDEDDEDNETHQNIALSLEDDPELANQLMEEYFANHPKEEMMEDI